MPDYDLLPILSERAEPPKAGTLFAIVEIDCAFSHNVVLPSGHMVPQGVHTVRVPEKDVPRLIELVEPNPELIATAERAHKNALESAVRKALEGSPEHEKAEKEAHVRETFPGSVSGEFARIEQRDMRPFRSVKVIDKGLLAEVDEEKARSESLAAQRVASAVGGGSQAGMVPLAEVQKMIDAALAKQASQQNQQSQQKR